MRCIVIKLVEFNVAAERNKGFTLLPFVGVFILERLIPVLVCNIFHCKINFLIWAYEEFLK